MIHEVFHDNGLRLLGSDGRCAHVSCSPVLVVADTPEEARIAAEAIADGHVACGLAFDCGVREAERDALRGIEPEFPPLPPRTSEMRRYGIRWNGPFAPLSVPMPDGYWTPWHIAVAAVAAERERCAALLRKARFLLDAADACDREAESHPSSRSSAPLVRYIQALANLRDAVCAIESGAPAPREG